MKFTPVPFTFGESQYQVVLGLAEVAQIEKACEVGFPTVMNQLQMGFLSAIYTVASVSVKVKNDLGFVPIEMNEVGLICNDKDAGFVKALATATEQLGNVLGLQEPSKKPSKSGSASD
jgi:hypothetical protein